MHDIKNILLKKSISEELSVSEQLQLEQWLAISAYNREVLNELTNAAMLSREAEIISRINDEKIWVKVKSRIAPVRTAHRVHFLKTAWFRYAAILIFLFGTAVYFLTATKTTEQPGTTAYNHLSPEVPPGVNRAVLTVGDKAIDLSSAKTGIAVGDVITYNDGERIASAGEWLLLTTPRSGQYQAVLPDGSKVWLNAASGIKFPSRFDGKERRVEVTGEVYLEVAKDKARPFMVDVNGEVSVEVLGTSFNINSYENEENIETTLLEGSVRVKKPGSDAIVLQPGQQARTSADTKTVTVVPDIDTEQIMAWKNGLFNFEGLELTQVMRQLERWYDIQVKFERKMNSNDKFKGKLQRSLNLSQVVKLLEGLNVRCRLKGRTLIVE